MQEIGKMFPDIKLSVVMDAESKFNQADINGDGVSDTVSVACRSSLDFDF